MCSKCVSCVVCVRVCMGCVPSVLVPDVGVDWTSFNICCTVYVLILPILLITNCM